MIKEGRLRLILISIIRIMLVLAFFTGLYRNRPLILWMSGTAFILSFLPYILEKKFKIKVPAKFEIINFLFLYGILFIANVRGLFDFWWWGVFLNLASGIALGLVGLSILHALYADKKINTSPFIVSVLVFIFAVAIGSMWEVFEFSVDQLFGFNMQKSGADTMNDLIVNSSGALLISLLGYYYIRKGRVMVFSTLVSRFVKQNPKIFGNSDNEGLIVNQLIEKGESKSVEFKSSLRTNLHTNQIDKKMEHAVLKTITAYLNSEGGTLLIGVNDKGEIVGLGKDQFESNDKLNLHFTNLLKNSIGSEYLPFIKSEIIKIGENDILKVECAKSQKHVFLKFDNGEEFYVRNGPSSMRLDGSALVNYISNNFMKL